MTDAMRHRLASAWRFLRDGAALNFLALGFGLLAGWAAILSPLGVVSLHPDYHAHQREERLLACLQEAGDRWVGQMCRYSFDARLMAQVEEDREREREQANLAAIEREREDRRFAETCKRDRAAGRDEDVLCVMLDPDLLEGVEVLEQ